MKAHEKLAEAIEASPLSLEEIAERSHVTPTALRRYAEGKTNTERPGDHKHRQSARHGSEVHARASGQPSQERPGFCGLIMATCPEPESENQTEEVCGHCPLAKMAKEYREKAEKIDREGRGIRY